MTACEEASQLAGSELCGFSVISGYDPEPKKKVASLPSSHEFPSQGFGQLGHLSAVPQSVNHVTPPLSQEF